MNTADLPEGHKQKVILIDDNADVLAVIKMSLELLGYLVWEFETGREALRQFSAVEPDIAIIDHGLPGLNGLEVGRAIRKLDSGVDCPLVLLTGTDGQALREEAKQAGFDGFLVKPVRINTLCECIQLQIADS